MEIDNGSIALYENVKVCVGSVTHDNRRFILTGTGTTDIVHWRFPMHWKFMCILFLLDPREVANCIIASLLAIIH